MRNEIRQKLEQKRAEIRKESERIRASAHDRHVCANCGKPLPAGRRLYCSGDCSWEFFRKYDYSQNSEVLRQFKRDLQRQYEAEHPKKEREPWSNPVARTEHECYICGLKIPKGEKYTRYTRLPGLDDFFDEAPYEVVNYHTSCQEFIARIYDVGVFDDDGFDKWELSDLFTILSWEFVIPKDLLKRKIREGWMPTEEQLRMVMEKYGWVLESQEPKKPPLFMGVM